MSMGDECTLTELGASFSFNKEFQTHMGNQWLVAQKLSTPRLLSLLTVGTIKDEFEGIGMTAISCIDAIPGLGIAGVLWSKRFGEKVTVTVNSSCENEQNVIKQNTEKNLSYDNLTVVQENTNALLHSNKKYNFIYLEAYGSCVRYLESACNAICHGGILCIVSTDLSTLYNKSPNRVPRMYHGHAMKHSYGKEIAVRLILANVARAASRWDRGISVLLSNIDDNCVTLIVRVLKGASHADISLDTIQKVAHCRVCNYRYVMNEKLYFTPTLEAMNCFCREDGTANGDVSPPIVTLGPVYTGAIFDTKFLVKLSKSLVEMDVKNKLTSVLQNMILESLCFDSDESEVKFLKLYTGYLSNRVKTSEDAETPPCKKSKTTDDLQRFLEDYRPVACPIFYYITQNHIEKGFNPPKSHHAVKRLRDAGYRSCKTIFEPTAIRTSASPRTFRKIMNEIKQKVF